MICDSTTRGVWERIIRVTHESPGVQWIATVKNGVEMVSLQNADSNRKRQIISWKRPERNTIARPSTRPSSGASRVELHSESSESILKDMALPATRFSSLLSHFLETFGQPIQILYTVDSVFTFKPGRFIQTLVCASRLLALSIEPFDFSVSLSLSDICPIVRIDISAKRVQPPQLLFCPV